MISNRIYTALKFLTPIFYHLGVFSLDWNSNTLLFILPKNRKRIVLVNSILYFVWIFFALTQIIKFSLAKDFNKCNFDFTLLIGGLLATVSFQATNFCSTECYIVLNSMFIFLRRVNCEFLNKVFHQFIVV